MIKNLCYDLYILDWKKKHNVNEIESMINYYRDIQFENVGGISYNDYIGDHGFEGQFYAYFNEFLDNEYLDKDYIHELLKGHDDLIIMYDNDINILSTDKRLIGKANRIGNAVYRLEIGKEYIIEKHYKDLDVYYVNVYTKGGSFVSRATLSCFNDVRVEE